jgi:hypothetical protein
MFWAAVEATDSYPEHDGLDVRWRYDAIISDLAKPAGRGGISRKHYVRIAELLAGEYALARHNIEPAQTMTVLTLNNVARSLADIFKQDNSRLTVSGSMTHAVRT